MYSTEQIFKGIAKPGLIGREIKFKVNSNRNFNYAINGVYWSGNLGDRALAYSFKRQLSKREQSVGLFPKRIGKTRSDVHVLGGGGVLRDCRAATNGNKPVGLEHRLNWVSKSDKSAIIGVGVPGFKTQMAKDLIESTLPNIDLITVRDEWSYEKLKKYHNGNIWLTACPAFLLEDPEVPLKDHTGVNFRPWPNYPANIMSYHFNYGGIDIDEAREKYIQNARRVCDKVENPVFIPFNREDEKFAKDHLNVKILPYKFSVEEVIRRVSSVRKMVSMRYHSLVFSAITDTPVLVLAYQPKVSQLATRLGVTSHKPHEEDIPIKFEYPANVDNVKEHAEKNFDLLMAI